VGAYDAKSLTPSANTVPVPVQLPHTMPTNLPCPFDGDATWEEGYVGYRWGDWQQRSTPH
jgi:hypothetical protein